GTCNPATGACSPSLAKSNGATCDDGNPCTQTDTCQGGVCNGTDPVVCTAHDQCHDPGTCDPTVGGCVPVAKVDGTACNDNNACTRTDTCQAGTCTGGSPVACAATDQCHAVGTCNPSTGVCSNPAKSDGAACDDGNSCTTGDTCVAGAC